MIAEKTQTQRHRFFDTATGTWTVKVYPGEFHVTTKSDERLVTVLGSCVAACIRDPETGYGGMNHFMLPEDEVGKWGEDMMSTRYGNHAMEKLVNEMIKLGCPRSRMEVKVFGGGNVIDSQHEIGSKNSDFILRYLEAEGLKCAAQDLKGDYPRRIEYCPATGKVVRRILGRTDSEPIVREETEYATSLSKTRKVAGEVELFGDFK